MPLMRIALSTICLLLLAGCSISDSISASFESSSASLASSSGSSSRDRASYRNDVRDYTSAYVKSGGQFDNFTRGLDSIAKKHGISDWESDQDTYAGIGAGLRAGGQTAEQFEVWKTNLAGGDATKAAAMQKGYNQ